MRNIYQALYRKWRPQTFDDVYGQPHIIKTLKTELETDRISHAYLFTGSRGTGKTTCAKILSKAVNCEHLHDGNPCNECEICKGIDNGSIMDVIEIDAASNNGVENIRDLREEANFTPANAKYRVYIIDEVHMLSIGAFNALLKTLEEPPKHVIFILATTDVHKLPVTILSRCQRFDFKRISSTDIVSRLNYIAEKENVTITEEAANLIANIADGGMRDSLSLMDRCLSITKNIDENTVSDAAGVAGTKYLFEFSKYISENKITEALTLVSKLHNESCDIEIICTGLTEHFRNLMVAKTVTNCDGLIICSKDEMQKYKERSQELKIGKILECIDVLSQTSKNIKNSSNKKIQLESAVIKMCSITGSLANNIDLSDIEDKFKELDNKINSLLNGSTISVKTEVSETKNIEKEPSNKEEQKKGPKFIFKDGMFSEWPDVLERLAKYDMPLFGLMQDTIAIIKDEKLFIKTENSSLYDFIRSETHYKELSKSIYEVTGEKIKVAISCTKKDVQKPGLSPLENLLPKIDKFNND